MARGVDLGPRSRVDPAGRFGTDRPPRSEVPRRPDVPNGRGAGRRYRRGRRGRSRIMRRCY